MEIAGSFLAEAELQQACLQLLSARSLPPTSDLPRKMPGLVDLPRELRDLVYDQYILDVVDYDGGDRRSTLIQVPLLSVSNRRLARETAEVRDCTLNRYCPRL